MVIRSLPLERWRHDALDEEAVAAIHGASLRVLERTGVEVGSAALRADLSRAGALVDEEQSRVRFAPELVEAALATAPRDVVLAGRDRAHDLPLDGRHGYLSVDGSAADILDPESGVRRASTAADLALVTRLADALPEIAFLWQGAEAGDVPAPVRPLHELRIQLTGSSKHVQLMTATEPVAARWAVEMAAAVAGGEAALRARPILSAFQCSLSPLAYDGAALEAALVYGRAGVPSGFVVMAIACATAPATRAGVLVQANAEILAGITVLETLVPGAPTFYGACPTVMDLRTGRAACGGPEDVLFQAALAQLGRRYGLPTSIGTFATGAKSAGWQGGVENALSGMASLLGGADMLSGAGLLDGASLFALEELVLDAELFGMLCAFAEPLSLAPEDLADELIDEVGPRGHYLAEHHTAANMRRLWMPRLFDRRSWGEWTAAGRPDDWIRAGERARQLLATHEPAPLAGHVRDELNRIVAAAEAEAGIAAMVPAG
jgi:trimethylamine---corrinoid protein Co-methyltransferase